MEMQISLLRMSLVQSGDTFRINDIFAVIPVTFFIYILSVRELNEYGGGITKPADLHVGLTDKTKQSLEQSISAQLDAAREYAKTAKTLRQNSAVPDIAVKMHLDSLRKACNIYAQHTVCLRNPPPELKALHDTFTGNMSVLNIPQISGPEVELLENEMYENLIQESSFSPLAANASAADMVGCYSNAMSVDIECLADKYSISSTGMFANWKRRRFTLCGCVLTYFNGAIRAGGLVISKDSNILSDSATGIHSQSRHFNRELLIDFAAPGIAGGSRLQLFIRFDDACTKDIWELSMNNLIQFLNI